MKRSIRLVAAICCLWLPLLGLGQIKLPALIGDNMVLQQQSRAPLWGWADPGTTVTVQGSWDTKAVARAKAGEDGKWMVRVKTPAAGGPYEVTITGKQTTVLHNVLIGEVWVCSGQSNMEMPLSGWSGAPLLHSTEEINAARYPQIHLFTVKRNIAFQPQQDCDGQWAECTPETAASFSATAYFFGRQLYEKLHVPIGLIHSSWGGTVAEAWTSESALRKLGDFDQALNRADSLAPHVDQIRQQHQQDKNSRSVVDNPNTVTVLYNGMIAPLIPFSIRGAIWYQGEANVGRAQQYERLFPTMIADWRHRWQEGNFPFYFVQIAPYPYGGDSTKAAALRDAQRKSLHVPHTGMVVTLDIGNPKNIHPANKQEVGRRLSLWALANTYGLKDIVYSGPLYAGMKINGSTIRVSFDHADGGLMAKGGTLGHFEIAGADGHFVPAQAHIAGQQVIVQAQGITAPKAVRYGWSDTAEPHLFNQAGLPASSFSTTP
jgi:sialate O-acetylesterase